LFMVFPMWQIRNHDCVVWRAVQVCINALILSLTKISD
jgi:hypothetical protein